jgi:hypothetical protein
MAVSCAAVVTTPLYALNPLVRPCQIAPGIRMLHQNGLVRHEALLQPVTSELASAAAGASGSRVGNGTHKHVVRIGEKILTSDTTHFYGPMQVCGAARLCALCHVSLFHARSPCVCRLCS